jgi:Hsp90 protein
VILNLHTAATLKLTYCTLRCSFRTRTILVLLLLLQLLRVLVGRHAGKAPCLILSPQYGHSANMERLMKAQAFAESATTSKFNSRIMVRLCHNSLHMCNIHTPAWLRRTLLLSAVHHSNVCGKAATKYHHYCALPRVVDVVYVYCCSGTLLHAMSTCTLHHA